MLTRGASRADSTLSAARLEQAIAFRETLGIDATAYRLVHGEADLLPSLIVDRYGDYLVVQALSQGIDRLLPDDHAAARRAAAAGGHPRAQRSARAAARRARAARRGAARRRARGDRGPRRARRRTQVDPWRGQKTGLFLDQRENRVAAARYARGRLLDAFSYNGGFALALAPHCDEVARGRHLRGRRRAHPRERGAQRPANVEARAMNVFDELRELERRGERFDTIVLDPPAFAKNKASVPKALSGYKEINLRALKLLEPGGFLVTCSCSYNVSEATFADVIASAAVDAARRRRGRREADAGARSSGAADRARDLLPEVLHPAEAAKTGTLNVYGLIAAKTLSVQPFTPGGAPDRARSGRRGGAGT